MRSAARICFWMLVVIGLCLSLPGIVRAQSITREQEAIAVLERDFGLRRLNSNADVWLTPRERDVIRRLSDLPKRVENVKELSRQIAQIRNQNRFLWSQREPALRKEMEKLTSSDPKRKRLERLLREGDATCRPPAKLGAVPAVQAVLIELTSKRHQILLDALTARRGVAALESEYATLARDDRVVEALEFLGHRLGPVREHDLSKLVEYDNTIYTLPHPLYLESKKSRVGAILNEGAPITFTWREGDAPTVITFAAAQAAGLAPPDDAPAASLKLENNRSFNTRRITVASIRFGDQVLRDVEAHVLPPEGEHLGNQISQAAFAGRRVAADPASLVFRIESESAAEPAPPMPSQSRR
jgi:hypothetical protein